MIRAITYIMGCGLVILRKREWNELRGHSKDRGKNRPNSRTNSLPPRENDVDQETLREVSGSPVWTRVQPVWTWV